MKGLWSALLAGLAISILEAGYGVDSLMARFDGLDLRLSENWQGHAGLKWAATCNQVCLLVRDSSNLYYLAEFEENKI
jgi:hypothetical protein